MEDEQLEQYQDLVSMTNGLKKKMDGGSQLGSSQSRQGAFRTNMIKLGIDDQQKEQKSKSVMNSFGNTLLNAVFFTNDAKTKNLNQKQLKNASKRKHSKQ